MIYRNKLFICRISILIICFIGMGMFIETSRGEEKSKYTLILYDRSKVYAEDENILNNITKMLLYAGNEIDIKKIPLENADNLEKYDEIFILQTDDDSKDNLLSIEKKLKEYDKTVYYFENNLYSQYMNDLNIRKEFYFYLNNVTPFEDLNTLISEINYLKDKGIKFFIEVPPIFVNQNLNAMKRFSECLRYAEANGGTVVLRFPVINSAGVNGEATSGQVIIEKINDGFINYTNYWVYPIALSVDDYILYREDFKSLIKSTNTLFLNSNDSINLELDNYNINSYENIIQKINIDDYFNENSNVDLYGKVAICVNSSADIDEFKKNVDKILKKEINFKETDTINSYLKLNDNEVVTKLSGIYFNKEDVTKNRFINQEEYEQAFNNEIDNEEQTIYTDLKDVNIIIKLVSVFALVIFVIILVVSRNIEKKKFFK